MEFNSVKLLRLIEARGPIYNFRDKEHSNKATIQKLWEEISAEMNCPVTQCKSKWTSLRSSYCRYLREKKCSRIVPKSKPRKKWYMAKSMAFLREYINPYRNTGKNSDSPTAGEDMKSEGNLESNSIASFEENSQSSSSAVPSPTSKTLVSELETEPMIDFLQSTTFREPAQESGDALFFRSLLADYEKLSRRRQRTFKMHMLSKMNELQEEQDKDAPSIPSNPSFKGAFKT